RLLSVELISVPDAGAFATAGAGSGGALVSRDGRFIAYNSTAGNIVPGQDDRNSASDVFLYDKLTGTNMLVSHAAGSAVVAGQDGSSGPVISANGRYIAYVSEAADLVAGEIKKTSPFDTD